MATVNLLWRRVQEQGKIIEEQQNEIGRLGYKTAHLPTFESITDTRISGMKISLEIAQDDIWQIQEHLWPGYHDRLILLRHRIGVAPTVLRGALQQGHRARVVARATIRCRRIVAIELATCRSGRTGGASGWTVLGNLRRRALIGGAACD